MIQFKLNGKPHKIASSWLDLTFHQYVKVMECKGGTAEIISIFTGIKLHAIRRAKFTGLDMVIESLSFLKTPYKFDKAAPNVGKYKLPLNSKGEFNIQFESLAQFEDMRAVMIKTPDNDIVALVKSYAQFVAIYLQKLRDGEYDPDKAIAMISEVYKMPAHEVITTGSFFFVKLLTLLTGTAKTYQKATTKKRKSKPVTRSSKKSLAITRRSRK